MNDTPRTRALEASLAEDGFTSAGAEIAAWKELASTLERDLAATESKLVDAEVREAKLKLLVEWQPIETAPRDGTKFVASGKDYGEEDMLTHHAIAYWSEEHQQFREPSAEGESDGALLYLTTWKPL